MQSIQEHFENYINECEYVKRLRPATVRSSREAYSYFRRVVPEVTTLTDLTPQTITIFFKRLQTQERIVGKIKVSGVKDSTIITYGSRLKTFFKWLADRQYIPANPFQGIKFIQPTFNDHRALTGNEIKRIMGAIAQSAGNEFLLRRDIAMVGILTFCGLRRNELASLELQDLDLYQNLLTVRSETSKSRRVRQIPINLQLKMHLTQYLKTRKNGNYESPYLFVSNNKDERLTLHGLKHWVNKISKLSGVKFHLHRFRHTFATNLGMQDVGAVKIQKLMGHKSLTMTQTYLRSITAEELRDDVNKLSFENLA